MGEQRVREGVREGGREGACVSEGREQEKITSASITCGFISGVHTHHEEGLPFPVASSGTAEQKLSRPRLCVSFSGVPGQLRVGVLAPGASLAIEMPWVLF